MRWRLPCVVKADDPLLVVPVTVQMRSVDVDVNQSRTCKTSLAGHEKAKELTMQTCEPRSHLEILRNASVRSSATRKIENRI